MKILVLDEEFPYPLDTGKRIRSFNLISRAAAKNEIHYLAYGRENSEAFRVFSKSNLHPIAVPPKVPKKSGPLFYLRLLCNLFSKYPYVVTSHYSKQFARAFERALDDIKPDLICCEWSPYAIYIKDVTGPRKLIVAHNIEGLIWRRYWENETRSVFKWYIGKQMRKMEEFEQAAFNWADGATAVSSIEAEQLADYNPDLKVAVIDNGVDLNYFTPKRKKPSALQLVFCRLNELASQRRLRAVLRE